MKFIIKLFKYAVFAFIGFILLFYATVFIGHKFIFPVPFSAEQTIGDIKTDDFCLGVGCQPYYETVEEFMPVFADQVKIYNTNATKYWPDNKVQNQFALVQSIEKNKAWLVSPNGEYEPISKKRVKELSRLRPRYDTGFNLFEKGDTSGVYLAFSERELKNISSYEKYQHLGTYDLFLTYSHELFHMLEQGKKWKHSRTISNMGRSDRMDNVDARAKRNLLFQQLLSAVAADGDDLKESLILDVISTYKDYKNTYPNDFEDGKYFDRIEGSALYFELVTSLYSAYPSQVYSQETLDKALKLLADNLNPYSEVGLVFESYTIGGWTGVLLDQLQENNDEWKTELISQPDITPLDLLVDMYDNVDLPEPKPVTEAIKSEVEQSIQKRADTSTWPNIFRFVYQLLY